MKNKSVWITLTNNMRKYVILDATIQIFLITPPLSMFNVACMKAVQDEMRMK